MFTVTLEGVNEVQYEWYRTVREIQDGSADAVKKAADAGVEEGKRSATWKDRTGAARRTITTKAGPKAFGSSYVDMVAPLFYHPFLDDGTKPHEIRPVRARFLRFAAADGSIVFTKRVRHPGTRGDGFAGKMYLKAERVLWAELEALVARVAARWD